MQELEQKYLNSREVAEMVGKVSDPRFGTVNTYHVDILNEVF